MEQEPSDHVFLDPDVIEVHLQNGQPLQPGLAKLIWAINQLFNVNSMETDEPPQP